MTFEWNAPCYIRWARWFTYANRTHYEYITAERRYIQEETRLKAKAKEKKLFLKEISSLPVQTRLQHDFGTQTIYTNLSPR